MNKIVYTVSRPSVRFYCTQGKAPAAAAAAEPKAKPGPSYGPVDVQRSSLMNGIKVAAAKSDGELMASCTIMFKAAGSRFECNDTLGVSHFLRNCSDTTGCSHSDFVKLRQLKDKGAYLSCSNDRQCVSYTLKCLPIDFPELKTFLHDTAMRGLFRQHEIDDRKKQMKGELTRMSPGLRVMDLLQVAAFSGPLSNSMFCPEERINSMKTQSILDFIKMNYRIDECAIGTVGIPFEDVIKFAECFDTRKLDLKPRAEIISCFRNGFEMYDLGAGQDCYIALGIPGCGTSDLETLFHYGIIAQSCGTNNLVAGQHAICRELQAPLGVLTGKDLYTDYSAFNISYKNTGLFGILAKTRECSARPVALAAAEFLRSLGSLSSKHIDVGKQRLKLSIAKHNEKHCSHDMAFQAAHDFCVEGVSHYFTIINGLANPEILKTAQCLGEKAKTCMAIAGVGDIGAIPHDCEVMSPKPP